MFIKENLNPKERKTGDCVIRAIAKAEGTNWLDVFDTLTNLARKRYSLPNNVDVYGTYLKKYEVIPCMVETPNGKIKFTVKEFADYRTTGIYIIKVAGHLTVVINGNVHDIWDCSNKKIYKIWKVK